MGTALIGTPTAHPDSLEEMRVVDREKPGSRWAAYQNHDLGSLDIGQLRFLLVGDGCTFTDPPSRYPDTQHGLGWRYPFVGWVDLASGMVIPKEDELPHALAPE